MPGGRVEGAEANAGRRMATGAYGPDDGIAVGNLACRTAGRMGDKVLGRMWTTVRSGQGLPVRVLGARLADRETQGRRAAVRGLLGVGRRSAR